tara:strand:+ start:3066 stop:3476 length:411 start_codon:yes stop_codon:yes gene_type:complete
MSLVRPKKVRIDYSPEKPIWGMFACAPIMNKEVIEECPVIPLDGENPLPDYRFAWPKSPTDVPQILCLPLGYGAVYNHSRNNSNANWINHPELDRVFQFIATRDIEVGEEVCTYYDDDYYFARDAFNDIPLVGELE